MKEGASGPGAGLEGRYWGSVVITQRKSLNLE